ncbi:MAG: hypothetical protein OXM55_01540 [Bdellovibrionales bacterium]|nr:hypothetical protein [Bdellovibrionales bacterium]
MFSRSKPKSNSQEDTQTDTQDQKPSVWEWLIHGKGSVSEDWQSAEKVLQDDSVKKSIKEVDEAFKNYQKSKNGTE